ncbi:MAG TPA: hypothetical protein VF596_10260 [Pyrinomonadaceae bacterium]
MADEKDKPKCARETCDCAPAQNSNFCSDECERITKLQVMEISCTCHHPECG